MKKIFFIANFLFLGLFVFAQGGSHHGGESKERIDAMRIAFITKKLNLSSEEAQRFCPIYNEFREKEKNLRQNSKPAKRIEDMTDGEAEQHLNAMFDNEQKVMNLRKEYLNKMKSVVSAKKVALLAKSEQDFREQLLNYAKEKHGGGGKDGGNRPPKGKE